MTTLHLRNSINPGCFWGFLLIPLLFGCFALSPAARADDDDRGNGNTSEGFSALYYLTSGVQNTANGSEALLQNNTGSYNTATGYHALVSNLTGFSNTANGVNALLRNFTGSHNTAIGNFALFANQTSDENTAIGAGALQNTVSAGNTACGRFALENATTGHGNVALGSHAGSNVSTASNVICIGADVAGTNTTASCFIGHIYPNVQPVVGHDPDSVTINSNGRLGRGNVSSRRYKHDIQPMAKASEVLFGLKPVSFRYNKEYDATQTLAFGLIAEEVAEVNPDLVGRNPKGQPESVRYEQVNAMLLNEFLKEHRTVEELKSTAARQEANAAKQEATIAQQQKQIEALTAGLQKVSAQIELRKPAPQTVLNN